MSAGLAPSQTHPTTSRHPARVLVARRGINCPGGAKGAPLLTLPGATGDFPLAPPAAEASRRGNSNIEAPLNTQPSPRPTEADRVYNRDGGGDRREAAPSLEG